VNARRGRDKSVAKEWFSVHRGPLPSVAAQLRRGSAQSRWVV